MMKKKGYSKGGMKKKGYAKGGMPMNPSTGKPTFVGDGKGKMAGGGSAMKKKGYSKGGTAREKYSQKASEITNALLGPGKTISDADRDTIDRMVRNDVSKDDIISKINARNAGKNTRTRASFIKRKGGGSAMKKKGYSKGGAMKRKGGGSVLNKKGYAKGGAARIF